MKIKIILWICLFCLVKTSNAQYDSVVKVGKKFYYSQHLNERYYFNSKIEISNTKIDFQGKSYNLILNSNKDDFPDSVLIREENKRVYAVALSDTGFKRKERVLYDYNLQKGDSFKFEIMGLNKLRNKDSIIQITYYIDSTYIANNRKHFILSKKNNFILRLILWVEGFGDEYNYLIYSYHRGFNKGYYSINLMQVCEGTTKLYPNSGICDSVLSVKKVEKNLKVFPNPAKSNFNIKLPNTEKHHLSIYNNMGKKMDDMIIEGKLDYEIVLNYPKGMYVLRIDAALDHYNEVLLIE